ncbi:N-acetylglucosaminyl phosphatidylinositol synthesis protein [Komagataella phaffii CBS 7435]|uniref:Membrane protein involved in the synthesis of N-acetylglucosaminyl phosphatidylinositol (GlcNAc-PI) n=2 Tax=Komagataella phaffii TaxID=460519 RepID=C4QYJ9_KOMPG|nr:Membrane protein involved in the synthesis of N-acetylglucosaminyl phosphatidylinositol (GlcNAc-PI) [Komagataella phaffii GS115]AOA60762.1 GQ67_01680T0 [Komagataella phaffii]CAH2447146.1 N-acetylglucosaminyl phosphatidylinositol synthesis protein [Komagataella phaffii CBS 7435]AOA65825.1 GQ68_01695T0 [Komagataella phaffii GS115]CAY68322.1 Membrane protein involved in the synthesis of N-acetylglucosaminyl phosphatidylinositol (GlcNAc-PI) [Komagataella phaffii GS115]CCA37391.1 N-acetylglucosa
MLVFWPSDLLSPYYFNKKCYVVGSNLGDKIIVITTLPYEDTIHELKYKDDTLPLTIVATLNFEKDSLLTLHYNAEESTVIGPTYVTLVVFKPPDSSNLEYYSSLPISIEISWTSSKALVSSGGSFRDLEDVEMVPDLARKMELHTLKRGSSDDSLMLVLKYINLNNYLRSKFTKKYANQLNYIDLCPWVFNESLKSKLIKILLSILQGKSITKVVQLLALITRIIFYFVQAWCLMVIKALNYRFWGQYSLASMSYFFHQWEKRSNQLYHLPSQYQKTKQATKDSEISLITGTKFSPAEYIKLYNSLWLIFNDLVLGYVVATYLWNNESAASKFVLDWLVSRVLIDKLNNVIIWLQHSPAGFKLNNELCEFFGEMFSLVLSLWIHAVKHTLFNPKLFKLLIQMVAIASVSGGVSFFISILLDLHTLVTFHIQSFYYTSMRLYHWQSNIIKSLFRLFCGKKYNILRHRIDSNPYDFDELLLGIILFTIFIYLLPTVFAFYLTFAIMRLTCLAIGSILVVFLILLNYLPLIAFIVKLKDDRRLPGGITLTSKSSQLLVLKSRPLTITEIIQSYVYSIILFNRVNFMNSQNYKDTSQLNWQLSPLVMVRKLLQGEIIEGIDYKTLF